MASIKIVEQQVTKDLTSITFKTRCTHCGVISVLGTTMFDGFVYEYEKSNKETYHKLCRCLKCDNLLLFKVNESYEDPDGYIRNLKDENVEQLWPTVSRVETDAPDRVRYLYAEAQKVKRFPNPYAVQLGRALEAAANDKGAKGRTLNDKLNWLVVEELLPGVFGEMAHVNRILRNWGAHDLDIEVEEEDVQIIDEFFETIIEYLYVAPAKLKKFQDLLDARKKTFSEASDPQIT